MSTTVTGPTDHHPLSPSKFPAWSECPAFDGQQDDHRAEIEANSDRARGTAKHAALAGMFLGQPHPFAGLSAEEIEDVKWTAEAIITGANAAGYHVSDFRVEQRLTLIDPNGFEPLYFGTADVEYGPYIEDAKFGEIKNYFPQMAGYALAKMERDGLDTVFARIRYGWRRKTVEHTITRQTAERVVYGILRKRLNPKRRPVACEYCGICQHAATCTAINTEVDENILAQRSDWNVRLPTASLREAGADPVLMGAMRWLWKTYIEPWGEAVERQTNFMASFGNVPLGFKKQDEKGRFSITAPKEAVEILAGAGVPRDLILAQATFTMSGLVKAYREAHSVSEEKAQGLIEKLLTERGAAARGEGSFKLLRQKTAEDDIRAALARPASTPPVQALAKSQ